MPINYISKGIHYVPGYDMFSLLCSWLESISTKNIERNEGYYELKSNDIDVYKVKSLRIM